MLAWSHVRNVTSPTNTTHIKRSWFMALRLTIPSRLECLKHGLICQRRINGLGRIVDQHRVSQPEGFASLDPGFNVRRAAFLGLFWERISHHHAIIARVQPGGAGIVRVGSHQQTNMAAVDLAGVIKPLGFLAPNAGAVLFATMIDNRAVTALYAEG